MSKIATKSSVSPVSKPSPMSGGIPLPDKPFVPSRGASGGLTATYRDFFSRAWEQFQEDNPEACITDTSLVNALRREWYKYLAPIMPGFNKLTASQVACEWYKVASRDPAYVRNPEVIARRS